MLLTEVESKSLELEMPQALSENVVDFVASHVTVENSLVTLITILIGMVVQMCVRRIYVWCTAATPPPPPPSQRYEWIANLLEEDPYNWDIGGSNNNCIFRDGITIWMTENGVAQVCVKGVHLDEFLPKTELRELNKLATATRDKREARETAKMLSTADAHLKDLVYSMTNGAFTEFVADAAPAAYPSKDNPCCEDTCEGALGAKDTYDPTVGCGEVRDPVPQAPNTNTSMKFDTRKRQWVNNTNG